MELLKKHWKIVLQLLLLFLIFVVIHWLIRFLPGILSVIARMIINVLGISFLGIVVIFFLLQIIQNFRLERSFIPEKMKIPNLPHLNNYRILNPLDVDGLYYKVQLHTHSNLSYDCKYPVDEIIDSYRKDGYQVLAITDHDRFSDFSKKSTPDFLIIPGIEETVPVLFWPIPLGKHLILINPSIKKAHRGSVQKRITQSIGEDALVIPAHLSWRGGAGTGRWYPEELEKLENLQFIEIYSSHSEDPIDFTIWHKLNVKKGPQQPIWGIAVDDSHWGSSNYGWIMVKSRQLDLPSIIASLKQGAFFATSGPAHFEIKVDNTKILVNANDAQWIRFYNAQNQVISVSRTNRTIYQTHGDEGFIRIEITDQHGHTAWSQPMWLIKK